MTRKLGDAEINNLTVTGTTTGIKSSVRSAATLAPFNFATTDVATGDDEITEASHGLLTGDKGQFTTTTTLPAGLSLATDYFAIFVTANTFKVATSLANAEAGTQVDITDQGTGTHTFTMDGIAVTTNDGFNTINISPGIGTDLAVGLSAGSSANDGQRVTLRRADNESGALTITDAAQSPISLRFHHEFVTLESDSTNWNVVGKGLIRSTTYIDGISPVPITVTLGALSSHSASMRVYVDDNGVYYLQGTVTMNFSPNEGSWRLHFDAAGGSITFWDVADQAVTLYGPGVAVSGNAAKKNTNFMDLSFLSGGAEATASVSFNVRINAKPPWFPSFTQL